MSTKSLDWLSRYGMGSSLSAEVQMVSTEMSEDSMSLKQIAKEHFIEMDKDQLSLKHIIETDKEGPISIRPTVVGSGKRVRGNGANFLIQAAEAERHAIQTMMQMGPPYPWDFGGDVVIDSNKAWEELMTLTTETEEEKESRIKEAKKQSHKFKNQINRRPRRKKR